MTLLTDPRRTGQWAFFRQWLRNPLGIAAVSPSSPLLARRMIEALPAGSRRLIELGGGTGAITRELLSYGIAPSELLVLELDAAMHRSLSQQFPGVHLLHADASQLSRHAEESGFLNAGPVDAVVSGLGLLSMPRSLQHAIVREAFDCMRPEGRLVQFTYGPVSPVAREVIDDLGLRVERTSFTWRNVPPAAVYVYERSPSRPVPAVPMGRRAG